MSLSMLCGNFKLQDTKQGKVHEQPVILFVPEEESTKELDKVKIVVRVSPNATVRKPQGVDQLENPAEPCHQEQAVQVAGKSV
eukprot:1706799-Ditylum_brightwellii.AAC.1